MNDRTLYESETNKSSVIMNVITPSSKSLIQIFWYCIFLFFYTGVEFICTHIRFYTLIYVSLIWIEIWCSFWEIYYGKPIFLLCIDIFSCNFAYMIWSIISYKYNSFPTIIFNCIPEILKMVYRISGIRSVIEIIQQILFRPHHGYVHWESLSTTVMSDFLLFTFKTHWFSYTWFLCYYGFIFKDQHHFLFLRADATCL